MEIPRGFSNALERAYHKKSELDKLFVEQYPFLMRLVRFALRHNHWAVTLDEDDMYQEACIWLVNSMWEWDETRGTPLDAYVVYNIGARLKNIVIAETRLKRRPKHPHVRIQFDNRDVQSDNIRQDCRYFQKGVQFEEHLDSHAPSPEEHLIAKTTCAKVRDRLPMLARELLDCLLSNGGNFSEASRQIYQSGKVRFSREITEDAFRQTLRRNIRPQIQTIFCEEEIITGNGKL